MTLPQVMALVARWHQVPPIAEAFASFIGHKAPSAPSASEDVGVSSGDGDPFDNLVRDFNGFTGIG